jgi:hypothetical protein
MTWIDIRTSLDEAAGRFSDLLAAVENPGAPAVGTWSIADTAAHVREVATLNSTWATGGAPPDAYREAYELAGTVSVDEVEDVNALALASAPERDLRALANFIEERLELMLYLTSTADGTELVSWLGGLKLPLGAVLGHTLSELLVHGGDIARAEGRTFPITGAQARLLFESFLIPLLTAAGAAGFGGDRSDAGQPVCCELRLRGGASVVLVADESGITVEEPGNRQVDAHVSADPSVMWLLMFNRVGRLGPALRGQVRVWGRRPWRLRHLMRLLETP